MAGPWEKYAATPEPPADSQQSGEAGPWAQHRPPPPEPPTTARGVARNVAAGATDIGANTINIASDPVGNLIGKPLATGAVFLHDLIAPWFGGERFPDNVRNQLLGDTVPQPGTRIVEGIGKTIGANPADVQATPAEALVRKVTGAAGTTATGGPGAALVGAGGALTGDLAARTVPEWAAPATELAGNWAGGKVTSHVATPVRTVTTPERGRLVEVLDAEGVPLTAGERTGSKPLMKTEQVLGQAPGSAGGVAADVDRQQRAVNSAVARRAGLDSDTLTTDVLNTHLDAVGSEIGNLATSNNMQLPAPFVQQIGQVRQGLRYLKTEAAQEIGARLDQFRDMITVDPATGNPVLAGQHYQNLMSDLREAITASQGSARTSMIQLRDMLRQQMEASMNPADAARWRELNRHYANGMVIRDAMGAAGAGAAEGNISLLQLRGAINRSLGSDAYARGYGDLNDLAHAGQSVLRKPPDSGTPQGTLINKLLTGGSIMGAGAGGTYGGVEGAIAGGAAPYVGPWAVGTAMRGRIPGTNYSPGQAYLTNQLARDVDPRINAAIVNAANAEDERRRRRGAD